MTAARATTPAPTSTLLDDPADTLRRDHIRVATTTCCQTCPTCGTAAVLLTGHRRLDGRDLPTTAECGACGATPAVRHVLRRRHGRRGAGT